MNRKGEEPDAPLTRPAPLCTMPRRHPSTDRASAVLSHPTTPFRRRHPSQRGPLRRGYASESPEEAIVCGRARGGRCALGTPGGRADTLRYRRRLRETRDRMKGNGPYAASRTPACDGGRERNGNVTVDLYEYQGRDLFEKHGLPVLGGGVAHTPEEARAIAERAGRPRCRQGAGQGRRPGQGRRRQAGRRRRRGGGPGGRHPRHGHQGPHGPQGDGPETADIAEEYYFSYLLDRANRTFLCMPPSPAAWTSRRSRRAAREAGEDPDRREQGRRRGARPARS